MLNERRMKMKKSFLPIAFMAVFMLTATNSQLRYNFPRVSNHSH